MKTLRFITSSSATFRIYTYNRNIFNTNGSNRYIWNIDNTSFSSTVINEFETTPKTINVYPIYVFASNKGDNNVLRFTIYKGPQMTITYVEGKWRFAPYTI